MIVQRQTLMAKPGCSQEAIDVVLAELAAEAWGIGLFTHALRAYTPRFSGQPGLELVIEWEFEDLVEFDRFWKEWSALPTTPAFSEKFNLLIEQGTYRNEIWNVWSA